MYDTGPLVHWLDVPQLTRHVLDACASVSLEE